MFFALAGLLVCGGLIEVLQSLRISPICSPTLVAWLRAPSCQTDIRLVVSQAPTSNYPAVLHGGTSTEALAQL